MRAVRDRRGPPADLPGLALRSLEGPDRSYRRVPARGRRGAGRAARTGRLDGHRRSRGVGVLPQDLSLRGRGPRHQDPQQPQQRRRDRGERLPVAGRRRDPEVDPRGIRAHGHGGPVEGEAGRRGKGGRDPASNRGRAVRLPGLHPRGGRAPVRGDLVGPRAREAPGTIRQGAHSRQLPDPEAAARLARPVRGAGARAPGGRGRGGGGRLMEADGGRLVIVSNRGPAQFERDESGERVVRRGGGGLVTALTGLVSHRKALWIASALTDEDVAVSEEAGGGPVEVSIGGVDYEVLLVESDPAAYDAFYNVIANPILWFIQHYLWDLSNAPDIRREETDAWELGYKVVNADLAVAVVRQIEDTESP